jgi:acetoin utilization deacetylase AcuC-like enzyme
MHTFYYPDHTRHDPGQLHKPDTPQKNAYYSEVAQRGIVIYEAIKAADLGPITFPGDFGIEPVNEVHQHGMLTLLQNAYQQTMREGIEPAIPNTFRLGRLPDHKPRSIWGQLGYYCFDTSSPIFEHTWEVAYWNAQTAISAAALVFAGGEKSAYALCRPPGHHAATDLFGGFCYLNNAAVAANWLAQQGQRVAILDIDYHHGNGTQAIFYGRSDVLFCSIHADPLVEYPYYWGYADEFGAGAGENYNFNFPLPLGTSEPAYLQAIDEALNKIRAYVPDILLVSLGVDTAEGDPVGGFRLGGDTFSRLGAKIHDLHLPAVVVQEGGYSLPSLSKHVVSFLKGVLGQ